MAISIFITIFVLALVVGLLVLVVSAARRRGAGGAGVDARSVRRFFQYVLLYALVVVVGIGLTELLSRLFGARPAEYSDDGYLLAQALAFVLVGSPLALLLAWWTWRSHRTDRSEGESTFFAAYLTLAALTGIFMAATSLQGVIFQAVNDARLDADAAGGLVAWGALWWVHWVAARRSLDDERGSPHLLLGSVLGLALAVGGLVLTLGTSIDMLIRQDVVGRPLAGLAEGGGLLVAGALVWLRYWVTTASRLPRGTLWLTFVLPVGVGGGLVLSLVGASRLLWSMLVWFLGDRLDRTASEHFEGAAFEVAFLAIGLLVWWYHRTVLGEDGGVRGEIRRVYEYLVAGIALVAAAIGVGTVLVALIEAVTPGVDLGLTVRNTLLAAVTLLLVGVPVWWVFWRRIRAAMAAEPTGEAASLTRRIYLIVLFGVAGIAAVVALIAVAFTFFQDAVNAQLGAATLRSMRYGLGVLVGTAAVSAYHGAVFRQDRGVAAVPGRVDGPRSVVLVGAAHGDLERAIARATGARVELWGRLDAPAPEWDEDAVLAALEGHAGQHVLVIADGGAPRVLVVDPTGTRSAEG